MMHAARYCAYYHDAPWARRLREGREANFADVPITPKEAVRENTAAFFASQVPPEDGKAIETSTSGSTGIPLRVFKTERHFAVNEAANRRLKQGWGFETHRCRLHATNPPEPDKTGKIEHAETPEGNTFWRIYSFNARDVASLLRETRATLLTTRPNVAKGVLLEAPDADFVRLVSTVSEMIPRELPGLIARIPGCLHFDLYGAVETGAMAGLCRSCGNYHIAVRQVVLEVLDDSDHPVTPGDMGRVVVTPLHNLAMPLLRYDIGDYAIRAETDACDGSGMALKKIVGRRRDLFKLPGGAMMLPYPLPEYTIDLPILQFKLVQTALTEVEVRYVPADPAVELDPDTAQRIVDEAISPLLHAVPVKVAELPLRANGKYVMHESLI